MDKFAESLLARYFSKPQQRTAATPNTIEDYISYGMLRILQNMTGVLQAEFNDSIDFKAESINTPMNVAVEGSIRWVPDPTMKGYIRINLGLDQFDLKKASLFLTIEVPNGKKLVKDFSLGIDWLRKPIVAEGKKLADILAKNWIWPFFISLSI